MKTRGAVTLVFDDGYASVFNDVVPTLNRLNMPAVFAIPLAPEDDGSATPPNIPWKQWFHLGRHEIVAHSIKHSDLTKLTPQDLEAELKQPAQKLDTQTLVYPGGFHNYEVVKAATKYYTAARTTDHGFEQLPPKDPMRLKTFDFTMQSFSPIKANLLALRSFVTNTWLIETFHHVTDQSSNYTHTVKRSELMRHIHFLTRLPIRIATIKEITNANDHKI